MTEEERLFAAVARAVNEYIFGYAKEVGYDLSLDEADLMYNKVVDALVAATDPMTIKKAVTET